MLDGLSATRRAIPARYGQGSARLRFGFVAAQSSTASATAVFLGVRYCCGFNPSASNCRLHSAGASRSRSRTTSTPLVDGLIAGFNRHRASAHHTHAGADRCGASLLVARETGFADRERRRRAFLSANRHKRSGDRPEPRLRLESCFRTGRRCGSALCRNSGLPACP
jgi:hypothetical protein